MKSTVAFEEIKNINAKLKSEHRDFMSHQEAFGSIYQQLSEVKECLANIENFLEQCLKEPMQFYNYGDALQYLRICKVDPTLWEIRKVD